MSNLSAFKYVDFHDFTIEEMRVIAGSERTNSQIVVRLSEHWSNRIVEVKFIEGLNIKFNLDFDVCQDNFPCNINCLESSDDFSERMKLLRKQRRYWNISYGRGVNPAKYKYHESCQVYLYRFQLFGGILEVLARGFVIDEVSTNSNLSEKITGLS